MKTSERGNAVIFVLVVMLACSGFIMAGLQTAFINGKIVYWDRSSLQAWQAADAGLAWAHCQLTHRPFSQSDPLQADIALPNGAHCVVSGTSMMNGMAREYTVISTGSYQGASYRATRKFTILPP